MKFEKIPKNLLQKVYRWKNIIENKEDFFGSSPPSIFISSVNYPKVNIGILSLPYTDERSYYFDYPEQWYKDKLGLEEIIDLRARMIYSFKNTNIKREFKLKEKLQELAISKNSVDLEVKLKTKPVFRFAFSNFFAPIGNPAKIEDIKIQSNIKTENFVEKVISDEMKAEQATFLLYQKGLEITKIQKIFSAGLLGIDKKLVPTRWSITAVDSIISEKLIRKIRDYKLINEIKLFYNEYLGNKFWIVLLPFPFGFEMIEVFDNQILQDYEIFFQRKEYAKNVAGGYYAARLACCEYLEKIKKQAAIIVYREIEKTFSLPLGVWKVRECIRDAFNKESINFSSVEELEKNFKKLETSKILRIYKTQKQLKYPKYL